MRSSIQGRLNEIDALDYILASPLVRAQQTRDVISALLPAASSITASWLKPNSTPEIAIEQLFELDQEGEWQTAMIVSHLPFVAVLVERICGLERGTIRMGTGSMVAIELPVIAADCGRLLWQQHPEVVCDTV